MSKELVAKLRSGFITDACGIPLRGSTEKIMDEAADLVESQAKELDKAETVISFSLAAIDSLKKELAEAQARVVELVTVLKECADRFKEDGHLGTSDWLKKVIATTDTAAIDLRAKYYEECAVILRKLIKEYQDDLTDPLLTALAEGRIYTLQQAETLIRAAIGEKP